MTDAPKGLAPRGLVGDFEAFRDRWNREILPALLQLIALVNLTSTTLGGSGGALTPVANLAALAAIDTTALSNGVTCRVTSVGETFELVTAPSADLIMFTDGFLIVQPTTDSAHRWVRL